MIIKFQSFLNYKCTIIEEKVYVKGKYICTNEEAVDSFEKLLNGEFSNDPFTTSYICKNFLENRRVYNAPKLDLLHMRFLNYYFCELISGIICFDSANQVVKKLLKEIENRNYKYLFRIDISKYYDNINRENLFKILTKIEYDVIQIKPILQNYFLRSDLADEKIIKDTYKTLKNSGSKISMNIHIKNMKEKGIAKNIGIPQGLPFSNILSIIYLYKLDEKYRDNSFRYADDIMYLSNKVNDFNIVKDLKKDYELQINKSKEEIYVLDESKKYSKRATLINSKNVKILGYHFSNKNGIIQTSPSNISIDRQFNKIRALYKEFLNSSKKSKKYYIIWKLNVMIVGFVNENKRYGWLYYFSAITEITVLYELDKYIVNKFGSKIDITKIKSYVKAFWSIQSNNKTTSKNYLDYNNQLRTKQKQQIICGKYDASIPRIYDKTKVDSDFNKLLCNTLDELEKDYGNSRS